jgi:hypothetical protein
VGERQRRLRQRPIGHAEVLEPICKQQQVKCQGEMKKKELTVTAPIELMNHLARQVAN